MKKFKRIDSSTLDNVIDATESIIVTVQLKHCKAAVRGDPERCALVLAAKQEHGFEEFIVHRTVAYAKCKGELQRIRYQNKATTRRFVEKFDAGDFSAITNGGISFEFRKPKAAISLSKLRSSKHIAMRQKSAKERNGKPKRPYRLPDPKTLAGVRNRFGYRSDE